MDGDMDALLIFPLWSCSLPCSWVSFGPHPDSEGWVEATGGRKLLLQAGSSEKEKPALNSAQQL